MNHDHFVRQSCGYRVRTKFPVELHELLGRKETRYSLHTGSLMDGKFKAKMIVRQGTKIGKLGTSINI